MLPAIGTDRSRPILKGDMQQIVDSLLYVPIDAECKFWVSDTNDGRSNGINATY